MGPERKEGNIYVCPFVPLGGCVSTKITVSFERLPSLSCFFR